MKKETDLLKSILSFSVVLVLNILVRPENPLVKKVKKRTCSLFLLISFVMYSDDAYFFMIYLLPLNLKKNNSLKHMLNSGREAAVGVVDLPFDKLTNSLSLSCASEEFYRI